MNKRQWKKWCRNNLLIIDRDTGHEHYISVKDFVTLAKIAGLTSDELRSIVKEREDNA